MEEAMKKMIAAVMVGLCVCAIAISGFAKNEEKANPGKQYICHFTGGGHADDMDFRVSRVNGEPIQSNIDCYEYFDNTIIIRVAVRGWENGHEGAPAPPYDICQERPTT